MQVKDEQFEFLFTSLKARSDQQAQSIQSKERALRDRVEQLETVISEQDAEKSQLRAQLTSARRKLSLLSNAATATTCWFDSIPDEVLLRIFGFFDPKSLGNISAACKYMNMASKEDFLWKAHFENSWGIAKTSSQQASGRSWRLGYVYHFELNENWKRQKATVYDCARGHSGTVTCLYLCKDRIFSGSDDGSMLVWEDTARVMHRLGGGDLQGGRRDIVHSPSNSPSSARLLPPPALPLAQLVGGGNASSNWVAALCRQGHRHGTGAGAELGCNMPSARSSTLYSKVRSFHGHGGPVWCLDYDSEADLLVSGSYDRTVKVGGSTLPLYLTLHYYMWVGCDAEHRYGMARVEGASALFEGTLTGCRAWPSFQTGDSPPALGTVPYASGTLTKATPFEHCPPVQETLCTASELPRTGVDWRWAAGTRSSRFGTWRPAPF